MITIATHLIAFILGGCAVWLYLHKTLVSADVAALQKDVATVKADASDINKAL
jgi:hypothetical protein